MFLHTLATLALLTLLGLNLAGCADRDEAIPPALAELHRRATGGDPDAQLELGMRYVTGRGTEPDERAARRWIGQAAAGQGNAAAQFELGSRYTLEPGTTGARPTCCENPPFKASPRRKPAWRCSISLARAYPKTALKPTPGSCWPRPKASGMPSGWKPISG